MLGRPGLLAAGAIRAGREEETVVERFLSLLRDVSFSPSMAFLILVGEEERV